MPRTARIALNRPLRRLFDYRIPEDLTLEPGNAYAFPSDTRRLPAWSSTPTLRHRTVSNSGPSSGPWNPGPCCPPKPFTCSTGPARYYQHPLGECLFMALPPALRRGQPAKEKHESYWQPAPDGEGQALPANAHRQQALLAWLQEQPAPASTTSIRAAGFTTSQLKSLADKQRDPPGRCSSLRRASPMNPS